MKEHERERYDFDPTTLESSSDRNEDLLRVKEDEADEQHKCIIETLKAAAPEWTFEQINFVAGSVVQ